MIVSIHRPGLAVITRHPVWALVAAFGTYFCMYGFRKPYTAAGYEQIQIAGLQFKFLLVMSQTIGYLIAKWIGIKFVAEIRRDRRIKMLLILIGAAQFTLFFFGLLPAPWNVLFILLNGLSLGIVFGLVLSFLEGRRQSEALIAGLCASFIVSDGFSKSVGSYLLLQGVSEQWMPFLAGCIFLLPVLLFIGMLHLVPAPDQKDRLERAERSPMNKQERLAFMRKFAPGILGITLIYLFVTFLRSIRADFAPELWKDLGFEQTPGLYTQSELLVSLGVIIISGVTVFFRGNKKAFRFSLITCVGGSLLCLFAYLAYRQGLNGFAFMALTGLGVYIPYVSIHTTVFERLIAATREKANIGFLMYLVDSVGYTGYALLLLFRNILPDPETMLRSFTLMLLWMAVAGSVIAAAVYYYFNQQLKKYD